MKKSFKKIIAVALSLAMVVAGMTVPQKAAKADIFESDAAWSSYFANGGTLTSGSIDGYTVTNANIGTTWWAIQTWVSANLTKGYTYTLSFKITTSNPKQYRVDQTDGDTAIFDATTAEWADNGDGTYTSTFTGITSEITETSTQKIRISYGYFSESDAKGDEYSGWSSGDTIDLITVSDFSLTREATGETEADITTAAAEAGYNLVSSDTWTSVGNWMLYAGAGSGAAISYSGTGEGFSDMALSITTGAGGNSWGIQAGYYIQDSLTTGTTYNYTMVINSDQAGTLFTQVPGVVQSGDISISTGDNTITGSFVAGTNPANGNIMIFPNSMPTGTHLTMVSLVVEEATDETTGTGETTTAEEETTTESTVDVPVMNGNPLIEINDFGNGDILYVAGLDVITGATSYNLYVDGVLWGAVTNGANLDLSNFTSGEHLFQVTGVNSAGESEKSSGYTITIPGEDETTTLAGETTTVAGETTTADGETEEETTTATTTTLSAPAGLTYAGNESLPYYFAWQSVEGATAYNIYVNNIYITSVTTASFDAGSYSALIAAYAGQTVTLGVSATDGNTESEITTLEYTIPGGETETTTEAGETTTAAEITMDQVFDTDTEWATLGGYTIYVGQSWNGSTAVAGVDENDGDHVKIQQTASNWGEAWGLQLKKSFAGLTAGDAYTVEWVVVSNSTDGSYMVSNDESKYNLVEGTQTITATITADDDGNAEYVIGLGWVGLSTVLEFQSITLYDSQGNVVYPTADAEETTTVAEETTTATAGTTQAEETTTVTAGETTTAAETVTAPAKAKLKKVTAKKVSANKLKLKIKKTEGATGYQVKVYKTKKKAKKNKKAIVKKNTKKLKVTIKSKKLKNKTKLFVRVRAYVLDSNGNKVYGKWSKIKKVKVK